MKHVIRKALGAVGYEVRHIPPIPPDPVAAYIAGGRVPWSYGYHPARYRFIGETLADTAMQNAFRLGAKLPRHFGVGLDERCVEYPWLFARLKPDRERMLDAGSGMNHSTILHQPVLKQKEIHILTLYPESDCFWRLGISCLFNDLRDIPIRDGYYDVIACISTLEHVGMDNSLFAGAPRGADYRAGDFTVALRELRRVLRPGGKLFVTVPYGACTRIGSFQQFDARLLQLIISTFQPSACEETYFRHSVEGWNVASAGDCADAQYVEWIMLPAEHRPEVFSQQPDKAAAARAVACVSLLKPDR